jgi:hypothetical protein
MQSKKRRIVGSPLTPDMLLELGALDGMPARTDGFKPDGDWVNTYRIWTCHGYRKSGNEDEGFLRLARLGVPPDGPFMLKIDQEILHDSANLHSIHAKVECSSDALASPIRWQLSSRHVGFDGALRPELGTRERSRIDGDELTVTTDGKEFRRKVSHPITADWCLFEALQRTAFDDGSIGPFDLLEGMSVVRARHRLSYRGLDPSGGDALGRRLHRFEQLGQGTLPYEYWLDEDHRLLIVVTGARAYILDHKAAQKADAHVAGSRRYQQQRQKKRKGGKAS